MKTFNKIICLDVETTGLNSKTEKIIEIGCVDITNGINNKKIFHQYINPGKHIPSASSKIHGITDEKIKKFLHFKDYAQNFLNFIENAILIIHNAPFDLTFLNEELSNCNMPELTNEIIDTLKLSKEKFPGQKASLDSLMKRFKINTDREQHGALLDAEILAEVYISMVQSQTSLELTNFEAQNSNKKPNKLMVSINDIEKETNQSFFEKKQ